MTDLQADRRVVVQEGDVYRIIGAARGTPPDLLHLEEYPNPLSLIKVKPRFWLYREIQAPNLGRFDDFHPLQL